MIEIKDVEKKFHDVVIKNFSYQFKNRGLVVILGHSGSGKSTLLNLISGVDNDYQGEIKLDGINLRLLSNKERSTFRLEKIGYVFQDFKLLNLLSVKDNILLNLDAISSITKSTKEEMLAQALNNVDLSNRKNAAIKTLSGGEQQRVAIARAIITEPKYLLCDEPTGNLDDKMAIKVFEVLKKYSENHLVIIVSHDEEKACQFADEIIRIKDGEIVDTKSYHSVNDLQPPNMRLLRKSLPFFSLGLCFRAGRRKIKEKKWRSVFVNLLTSFSLLALGVGIVIGTTLRGEIVSSFKSIINQNEIIVSRNNDDPNPYTSFVASDEMTAQQIYNDYGNYCYGLGVTYLNNFNTFFKTYDRVNFRYQEDFKISLPAFHSALFVNYVWPEEKVINRFYPSYPEQLSLHEVVLGIPYSQMVSLCQALQIQRSFEALGAYIEAKNISITLEVANDEWQYQDKQSLDLKAVYNSSVPEVLHSSHSFNQYLFETEMRFPTSLDISATDLAPYTLKKVYTLHTVETPTDLIEELSYDERFNDVLLERSETFLNQPCITDDSCLRNVVLIFTVDKNAVAISDIIYFKKIVSKIKNYYPSNTGGYQMHNSGLLAGFMSNVGFSFDSDKIVTVGDYFARQSEGEMEDFPGVAIGSITRFNNNGVLFSSDLSNIKKGVSPQNYSEIVISTGLLNFLGYQEDDLLPPLYYCMYSTALDAVVINQFTVVGLVENEKNYIYHFPLFPISFFRDRLGVSSFDLIPTSLVLTLEDDMNLDLALSSLSNAFKEYRFTSPLQEISASVDEVMDYVRTIASVFVSVTLVVTVMLIALIAYLNAIESKKEIALLKHLGHPTTTIMQYIVSHAFVTSLITSSLALAELIVFQLLSSGILSNYFGGGIALSIAVAPIIVVVLVGLTLPLIITMIVTYIVLKTGKR